MTINSSDTICIDELATKLNCSQSTVRRMLKAKRIPQPIRRKSKRETLRWRRSDINKFFGSQNTSQKPESSLEQLIRALVMQEFNSLLREHNLA